MKNRSILLQPCKLTFLVTLVSMLLFHPTLLGGLELNQPPAQIKEFRVSLVQDESVAAEVNLEQALRKIKEAGGVAAWVSQTDKHLIIHRFNRKELRIPLTKLAVLPQVKTLTLHGYDFGDDDLKAISHWKHLEGLHLINNHEVTDAGMKRLENMSQLKELILWDNKVGNAGMKAIAGLPALEKLEIDNCSVGDPGLEALIGAKKLTRVNLGKTNVTKAGVDRFKLAMPKCEIEYDW